jgi:hypothetical protein
MNRSIVDRAVCGRIPRTSRVDRLELRRIIQSEPAREADRR